MHKGKKTECFQQSSAHHLVCISTGDSYSERTLLKPHSTLQLANELVLQKTENINLPS